MTDLTPAQRELRGMSRELATELRAIALAVDADPFDSAQLRNAPVLELLRVIGTPKPFRAHAVSPCSEQFTETCLGRIVANIELARGDAGALNACAAPSLAGFTVDALGNEAQQELFYRELAENRPWTFFGMTEPTRGSDAAAMQTRLEPDADTGYRLHGTKRYVANAARGAIGVVFARTGPTALSIRAAILRHPTPGFTGTTLDMMGLRGACIGEMSFDGVPVPQDMVLGRHLAASRRGLWGANRAFNIVRLQIAAQALGVAFAIRDLVRAERPCWPGHELMSARLGAARELLYDTAIDVDHTPDDRRPPSVAKLHATNLAIEVGRWAESALGAGSLLAHPLLEKWCRDIYAFEFMDGTTNILRLIIAPTAAPHRERS